MSSRLREPQPLHSATDAVTVVGCVERVTFESEQTGFRVLRVQLDGEPRPLTVVGNMQHLTPGARVHVTGTWEVDPRHGRQLRAQTVLVLDPDTREGMARYLGSGLAAGIGPVFARRVVEHFGDATFDVLDKQPERLAEVPGLGQKRAQALVAAWAEHRAVREVMVFLEGHGVSPALALRVFKRYGRDSVRAVSANPYRLAGEVWGIGFRKCDAIAKSLGIGFDDPKRLRAGVLYVLEQMNDRGHVFAPRAILVTEAERLLGVSADQVEQAVDALGSTRDVRIEQLDDVGVVVYGARRYVEEMSLAQGLVRLMAAPVRPLEGVHKAIAAFESATASELAPEQRQAVQASAGHNLLVITGGPGVGKTTIVRALLTLFEGASMRVRLAAPTGRASRRLAEATGREAQTLHRLLEFDPRSMQFQRNEGKPLELDALIVDESSMIDQAVACALVRAVPTGARLVLVGDVDQLPSIGEGAVLRDIIESGEVPCARLTRIFRQASASRIVLSAHRIRDGLQLETTPAGDKHGDFYVIGAKDGEDAARRVLLVAAERIPRQFGFDPRTQVQVLAPMRKGPAGADALNALLQQRINPHGQAFTLGGRSFRVGDKVMQLRNDYTREVFNGDVGFVQAVDPEQGKLTVLVEGRPVTYEASQLDELRLSYACSIHKSQGSEYPAVVIPLVASHFVMLTRNLLYTAVTRAKKLAVIVAEPRVIGWALAEQRREERYTYLFERLRQAARRAGITG